MLGLYFGNVDLESLAALPRFPVLRELTVPGLGDDGFASVGQCEALETLTCMYTRDIGDAAIEHIAGLRKLRTFYAGDTSIGDRSMEILGALPSLEDVELWSCLAVTDAGLAALARGQRLRTVTVGGAPYVTRAAASHFAPTVKVEITG